MKRQKRFSPALLVLLIIGLFSGCAFPNPPGHSDWTEPEWFAEAREGRENKRIALQDCLNIKGYDLLVDDNLWIVAEDLSKDPELRHEHNEAIDACHLEIVMPFIEAQFNADRETREIYYQRELDRGNCYKHHGARLERAEDFETWDQKFVDLHIEMTATGSDNWPWSADHAVIDDYENEIDWDLIYHECLEWNHVGFEAN